MPAPWCGTPACGSGAAICSFLLGEQLTARSPQSTHASALWLHKTPSPGSPPQRSMCTWHGNKPYMQWRLHAPLFRQRCHVIRGEHHSIAAVTFQHPAGRSPGCTGASRRYHSQDQGKGHVIVPGIYHVKHQDNGHADHNVRDARIEYHCAARITRSKRPPVATAPRRYAATAYLSI